MTLLKKITVPVVFALFAAAFVWQPKLFCTAFVQGLAVWANNVLPVLFPFCLLAPIACKSFSAKVKFTKALFNQDADGLFLTSLVCGYPVGAKLISECKNMSAKQCVALSSFCSTAGPIFLLTVVCPLLDNVAATAILLFTQLVACILNGLIFRNRSYSNSTPFVTPQNDKNFSETLLDSVLAMLNVGALIALAYMLSTAIKSLLPQTISDSIFVAFFCGLLEMTSGVFFVSATCCDTLTKTVLFSTLLGFGGLGIMLQSMSFLSKRQVKTTDYIKTKMTQSSLCAIISYLLCKIFL